MSNISRKRSIIISFITLVMLSSCSSPLLIKLNAIEVSKYDHRAAMESKGVVYYLGSENGFDYFHRYRGQYAGNSQMSDTYWKIKSDLTSRISPNQERALGDGASRIGGR